jgi:iron(III) transport system substrate-binding protein
MKLTFRRVATAATALAMAAGLAACGSAAGTDASQAETSADPAWQKVIDAANAEGAINVYNTASEVQNKKLQTAWEKAYPKIKLTITRGVGELPARVSSELQSGNAGADAFVWSDPAWFSRNEQYLADLSDAPNAKSWPQQGWAIPNKAAIATMLPYSMIVWNTDAFPNGFKKWDDLLAPEVKGKLGARSEVTVSVAGYLDFMETKLGEDYIKGIAKQNPKFYSSSIPLMQAVASGELGVANIGVPATVLDLKSKGAPIDFAYMKPGYGYQHAGAAFAKSGHPNAGRVFMNWFMSKNTQTLYNGDGQGGSVLPDIPGEIDFEGYTMLDSNKYTPEVLKQWDAKFHGWFG